MKFTIFTWLWITWGLMFIIVEYIAITNGVPGDTLSEHIWWLIGTKAGVKTVWNWIWRIALVGGIAWMIPHFLTGWKWFKRSKK